MEEAKQTKPPPIYIAGVSNIKPLTDLLDEFIATEYVIKTINEEQIRVQIMNPQMYAIIVKELIARKPEFHTYKSKQDRSFRVVLRNMHSSTNLEDLKQAINTLGHEVTNIWNIRQRGTKKPLPLFYI